MPATKILWGHVITVFAIVLLAIWTATEWTAWQLGSQPELGRPWFEILHFPLYLPPAFFWWWYAYDAYAPSIFIEGAWGHDFMCPGRDGDQPRHRDHQGRMLSFDSSIRG